MRFEMESGRGVCFVENWYWREGMVGNAEVIVRGELGSSCYVDRARESAD